MQAAVSPIASVAVCALAAAADLPGIRRQARVLAPVAALSAIALFVSLNAAFTLSWTAALGWGVLMGVLCIQVATDLATHTLPREVSLAGVVVVGPLLAVAPSPPSGGSWGMLLGASAMTIVAAMLFLLARDSFGVGDVFLSPLLGIGLGWVDPWLVPLAWLLTAMSGAVVIVVLLLARRIARSGRVPYGPFMVLGAVVATLLGAGSG